MVLTRDEAAKLAQQGRVNTSAQNLKMIYERIADYVAVGRTKMVVDGEYLLAEVRKELLDNGYLVHPNEGADYENPVGQWTIYWGYADDEKKDLFNDDDRKDAFS